MRALPTERYLARRTEPRTLQPTDRLIVVYHRIMNISFEERLLAFHLHPLARAELFEAHSSRMLWHGPRLSASLNARAADVVAWLPSDGWQPWAVAASSLECVNLLVV